MIRTPGLWLLLSAGVLWLCFQDVNCVRATSLIFGKTTTTTTTTSTTRAPDVEGVTEAEPENTTLKSNLTGVPQLDYVFDPNLPRELNGFNLADYPFYDRLPPPEEMDFKCDGLHDGFYASVAHKCQVYHHCLFGTRYDFLCANYTAFDQKTFICHFASEVDCANSKKFWHRNDALYIAQSTTTIKPPQIVYTPPSPSPILTGGAAPRRPLPPTAGGNGGGNRRRKPLRRRRPQYDYYEEYEDDEEYYDEPRYPATESSRSDGHRRSRPRPRPRPVYDDDYEEYEDERYERRGSSRRRPRPSTRRNKDRRKYADEYEDEVEDEDPRFDRTDEVKLRRNKNKEDEDDAGEERRYRNRKGSRRPVEKDEHEERRPSGGVRKNKEEEVIKPTTPSGSIFDRPRVPPKIRPPVPKSEADKYTFKTSSARPKPEYIEDYEDEEEPKRRPSGKTDSAGSESRKKTRDETKSGRPRTRRPIDEDYEYEDEKPRRPLKPKNEERRVGQGSRKRPAVEEYEEYEEEKPKPKPKSTTTTTTTTTSTTTTTTTEAPVKEPVKTSVRIVKRPFLPSRGGNPYTARGLQSIGTKADPEEVQKSDETRKDVNSDEIPFKPSPVVEVQQRPVQPVRYTKPIKEPPPKQDPLDINENEYDVTLNDALNPTLPNLPVRSFPTGFGVANDYTYSTFQRPRYVVDATINQASSEYNLRYKHPQPQQQQQPQQEHHYSKREQTYYRPSTRQQTQAYYTTF